VNATTKLSVLERLHQRIFGNGHVFDQFELDIINRVVERLGHDDAEILKSQVSLINAVYRNESDEGGGAEVYFYWKYCFRSRLDFPLKWPEARDEKILARVNISYEGRMHIVAELFVVLGVFFFIRFKSDTEEYRPYSPHYVIEGIETFKIG
jgi:hypothetical protein